MDVDEKDLFLWVQSYAPSVNRHQFGTVLRARWLYKLGGSQVEVRFTTLAV